MSAKEKKATVTIGPVRLSYEHIWEPFAFKEGDEPKYSASLIIKKSDKENLAKVKEAMEAAILKGINSCYSGGKRPKKLELALRDGDVDRDEDEAYAGAMYINAKSSVKYRPFVVDKRKAPISDEEKVYSGCYVQASVTFYPYENSGNTGVGCSLNGIMKWEDGEKLANSISADEAFADIEVDDDDLFD
ncbi:DUF2815 family protein [Holdemania massiliensis]|uniref:DUF2815 family protein n=1 Tax=Holdemania massiliensis TaxID=1468449 RepID=UPI001F06E742|nr:DUF2815 family protein [Holdemania massiliensis]MCH1940007.1 DUF2815 family protein [Holdemania massiliensis]MCH1940509.1 DUF2815 family protein [Holdemania massiliensis]